MELDHYAEAGVRVAHVDVDHGGAGIGGVQAGLRDLARRDRQVGVLLR
eukprot:gene35590-43882_t